MHETDMSQLAEVVDEHDDLVRELFHLDRFVTLIGYDPIQAKRKPPVWPLYVC